MAETINISQIYAKAMHASLENAIRWLEDAKLLAEHDSSSHCLVLHNFASEELAKTVGCWLVVNSYLRDTHPLVHYNSGTGVFRDHDVKYLVWTVLGTFSGIHTILQKQNRPIPKLLLEQFFQNPQYDARYLDLASRAEESRRACQYVDVYQKNDSWVVSNPLKLDTLNFLEPRSPQEISNFVKERVKRPFPSNLQEEAFAKHMVELSETDLSGYDNFLRDIEFMKYLIAHPRSEIARLFHEEIIAKYELFEINRKRIKKDRVKRKNL